MSPPPAPNKDEKPDPVKIGTIRPSQTTHTFGPGAIVELPYMSVVIPGLDAAGMDPWQVEKGVAVPIDEDRLLQLVRRDMGPQVTALRGAPWSEDAGDNRTLAGNWTGLWAMTFPRWLRCSRCNALSRAEPNGLFDIDIPLYRPDESGYWHSRCPKMKGGKARALPVRFVLACKRGHLDDFPWEEWAHKKSGHVCPDGAGAQQLKLLDSGYVSRATSQRVRCDACGGQSSLVSAFGRDGSRALPECAGGRPHLNDYDPRGCGAETRALLIGASNMWFSVRRSALSIPPEPRPVERVVTTRWSDLEHIDSREELGAMAEQLRKFPMGAWLDEKRAGYTLDELWEEYQRQRAKLEEDDPGEIALLGPEFSALTAKGGIDHGIDFAVSDAGPVRASRYGVRLGGIHLATRLREVVAITGFTRLDSYDPNDEGSDSVVRAKLSANPPTWAPAAQSRGEGVMITLDEQALHTWEERLGDRQEGRHQDMKAAHEAWRQRRMLDKDGGAKSNRFVLLHTLSHLLINAVSLRSGYSTASIRERIYCQEPEGADFPMAGILLYTAAADSEGTLGGLVSIGRPEVIGPLVDEAIDNAKICSSDPFCASHKPNGNIVGMDHGQGDGTLHGAACHVCIFLPETSCDHANRYLDRAFVVPTLTTPDVAYFQ
ncbi:DUF1998 domain-containing protein [Salsipaludibacter albus]|uniref:DUF1998 domain-containing protein n=1 Tax=Salsipaludibacter albus TaxID=2849650 RepID=UPI001EE40B0F|nr:DUF1998 domain-containing protein [Salsipaludibacter albus]MBY5162092.1 DUF1998 domain-containing protein [Salsipaludibacter albus]